MVPVVLTPTAEPPVSSIPKRVGIAAAASLRLSLGNGTSLSLEIAPAAEPALVRELAGFRC